MKPGDYVLVKSTGWRGKITDVKREGITVEFPFDFTVCFDGVGGYSWNTLVFVSDELEENK